MKTLAFYEKSHEKAYSQILSYMDRLGVDEGWLVVADRDLTKPWDEKIRTERIERNDKAIHVIWC